ncbi:taurine catabolism dioxygenase TauD, TfdA family protein [Burkholderia mallei]|uniref:TauD/TfdA family dioxygenase n=1 Tax=Burkholderia mallei TaxID=13373 RepID=UPI0004675558|nr:TauD/TfdA family dioxygenase [Burkholderia mallei]AIO58512.1 taurine catabolism dioxygenase TauD, TfdA family protein [Burkholderia mallei]AJX53980.1 taurine catabolism dioxygenase TauD, TfdA family protein [Burkholderia mallei]RPA39382.1 syringomycin synthesis regulator SyrP [Burkholderia mallei]
MSEIRDSITFQNTAALKAQARLGPGVICGLRSERAPLPLVVSPHGDSALAADRDAALAWFDARRAAFDALLLEHGGLLLRGFAVPDTHAFRALTDRYPPHAFGYIAGASPRKAIDGNVYESTHLPAPYKLSLHQEKAYMSHYPRLIAFYCRQAAAVGGETPLSDMRAVTRRLPARTLERFRGKGVMYRRNFSAKPMPAHFNQFYRRWQDAFMTDERAEVESLCRATQLEYEWLPDGSLTVTHVGPATVVHPRTGEEVWFNHASTQHINARVVHPTILRALQSFYKTRAALPYDIRYGDGTPMPAEDLDPVYDAIDAEETAFRWREQDVLLLDNILVAHGRNPYSGQRDIQVAMMD